MPDRELDIRHSTVKDFYDKTMDAIDLASDQDQRTRITSNGKIIAWIVTAEDGELLGRLDPTRRAPLGYPVGVVSHPGTGDRPDDRRDYEEEAHNRTLCPECGTSPCSAPGGIHDDPEDWTETDAILTDPETMTAIAEAQAEPPDTLREMREQ